MSRIITNLKVQLGQDLRLALENALAVKEFDFEILRKSIDARGRVPHYVYTIQIFTPGEPRPRESFMLSKIPWAKPPVAVVGSGPAGLFASLRLAERGIPVRLFERGSTAEKRLLAINRFWRQGQLDPNNNVGFGEGGAGLYSDGKLITRIRSPHIPYIMDRLIQFGGPEEIRYLANPHVGSDKIRRVIPKLRQRLLELDCKIFFDTPVIGLKTRGQEVYGVSTHAGDFEASAVILATGHSAEDVFAFLADAGVALEPKAFAMGLRVEHDQTYINQTQYKAAWELGELGAANYKLTHHNHQTGVGVYTFCMCPGGYVLSATTGEDLAVCNGMSNFRRNSDFANSAIVVSVDLTKNLWDGYNLRKQLEREAFRGSQRLPAQKLLDFLSERDGPVRTNTALGGAVAARLDQILPSFIREPLREGLTEFANKMPGYLHPNAQLYGVESRTSCPLRIPRNELTLQSLSHSHLYPTGEGAGYAGGITSAACDGVNVADAIIRLLAV